MHLSLGSIFGASLKTIQSPFHHFKLVHNDITWIGLQKKPQFKLAHVDTTKIVLQKTSWPILLSTAKVP